MTLPSPFPSHVAFAAVRELPQNFALLPEEQAVLTPRTAPIRRQHFQLGRAAARACLRQLTGRDLPIPRADDGRPLWPAGMVGAITHSGDVAAAAVAPAGEGVRGIGLDLEDLDRKLTTDIAPKVCTDSELPWVRAGADDTRLKILFAAKEAIFKALYPLELQWLGFSDALLSPLAALPLQRDGAPAAGELQAELLRPAAQAMPVGFQFTVRWRLESRYVLAWTLV